jgi:hypothetical protein
MLVVVSVDVWLQLPHSMKIISVVCWLLNVDPGQAGMALLISAAFLRFLLLMH